MKDVVVFYVPAVTGLVFEPPSLRDVNVNLVLSAWCPHTFALVRVSVLLQFLRGPQGFLLTSTESISHNFIRHCQIKLTLKSNPDII